MSPVGCQIAVGPEVNGLQAITLLDETQLVHASVKPKIANQVAGLTATNSLEKVTAALTKVAEVQQIPLEQVVSLTYNTGDDVDLIYQSPEGAAGNLKLILDDTEQSDAFLESLQSHLEAQGLVASSPTSRLELCWRPAATMVGALVGGGWMAYMESQGEFVVDDNRGGRKRAMARAFFWTANTLGPIGCAAVGLLIAGIAGWILLKRMKEPVGGVVMIRPE